MHHDSDHSECPQMVIVCMGASEWRGFSGFLAIRVDETILHQSNISESFPSPRIYRKSFEVPCTCLKHRFWCLEDSSEKLSMIRPIFGFSLLRRLSIRSSIYPRGVFLGCHCFGWECIPDAQATLNAEMSCSRKKFSRKSCYTKYNFRWFALSRLC